MIVPEISCYIVTVAGWMLLIAAIVVLIYFALDALEAVVNQICEITAVGREFAAFVHQRTQERRMKK